MKRMILTLLAIGLTTMSSISMAAMSNSRVRKETRFLTDKMAYELNLTTPQYNDVYEINFDFISSVRYLMDDVIYGYEWALDDYYNYLDVRNDDLRWVLSDMQYRRFLQTDYFYRPIYASGNGWNFRVYITYTNRNHFFFPKPYHYRSYSGGHYRTHFHNMSYYRGRYNHSCYAGNYSVRNEREYHVNRRSDFGSVSIRPNTGTRPSTRPSSTTTRPSISTRPGTSSSTSTSTRPSTTTTRSSSSSSSSSRGTSSSGSTNSGSSRRSSSSSATRSTGSSSRSSSSTTRSTSSSSRNGNSSSTTRSTGSSSRSSSVSGGQSSSRSSSATSSSSGSSSRRSSSSTSSERGSSSSRR